MWVYLHLWKHLHLWKLLLQNALKCCCKIQLFSWNHRTFFLLFCGKACFTMVLHIVIQAEPFPFQSFEHFFFIWVQHWAFKEVSAIPTACRKKQQRQVYYFCHNRAQLWCWDSYIVDAGQILTKLGKRELLITDISSVGDDDKNTEMDKGKLKKSFKNCVRDEIWSGHHSGVGYWALPKICLVFVQGTLQ